MPMSVKNHGAGRGHVTGSSGLVRPHKGPMEIYGFTNQQMKVDDMKLGELH